jgi:hypothetical protein
MIKPIVETPDDKLKRVLKPELTVTPQLELNKHDCLIACAGFEDRASACLNKVIASSAQFTVVLIDYRPDISDNRFDEMNAKAAHAGARVVKLTYDRESPTGFGSLLLKELQAIEGRVFLDISGMSRLLIVQVVTALASVTPLFAESFIIYAEAKAYPPTRDDAEREAEKCDIDPTAAALFLSSGVFDITLIPELSSLAPSSTQTRLIAFPSFDAHQLTALRNELQPSRFTFIEGVPPNSKDRWRKEMIARLNRLESFGDAERIATSTLDYRETLDVLIREYQQHSVRDRMIISPTGSKMQTVAVGIFRSFVSDVQIAYPTPQSFRRPKEYTIGVTDVRMLKLHPFAVMIEEGVHVGEAYH